MKYLTIKNLFIVLILCYIFSIPVFIDSVLEANLGIRIFDYYQYIFLLPPVLFFLGTNILNNKLKIPYFKIFCLVLGAFLLLESQFFRGNVTINKGFIYQLFIIYTCFLVLINYGLGDYYRNVILFSSLGIIFLMDMINYLTIFGILKSLLPDANYTLAHSRVDTGLFHVDGFSWINGFGIFVILYIKHKNIITFKSILLYSSLTFYLSVIFINASRGAFIVAVVAIAIYLLFFNLHTTKLKHFNLKIIFLIIFIISCEFLYNTALENLFLFKRFAYETNTDEARVKQIILSWRNFVNNPIFGVGFHNATRGDYGLARSNFSYTQILASHGIFYFVIYLIFLIKLFGTNYKKMPDILFMIFGYIPLMFDQLCVLFFLAIIGYLNYYEMKLKGPLKIQKPQYNSGTFQVLQQVRNEVISRLD